MSGINYDTTHDEAQKTVMSEGPFFSAMQKEGEYIIRFAPPSHDWAKREGYQVPWKIFRHHWVPTPERKLTLICAKSHDEEASCWLCEKAQELMSSDNKENQKNGSEMQSQPVMFGNVVMYQAPDKNYGVNGEVKIFQTDKKTTIQGIQRMFDTERTMFVAEPTATHKLTSGREVSAGIRIILEKISTGPLEKNVKYEVKTDMGCSDLILPNGEPFSPEEWDKQSYNLDQCTQILTKEEMEDILMGKMEKPRVFGPGPVEEVNYITDKEVESRVE